MVDEEHGVVVGTVLRRRSERWVGDQRMQWRAVYGSKWIDIPNRRSFVEVYDYLHSRED